MRIVAVVPAYNEAPVVGRVVRDLRAVVDSVVVVDDGSSDETAAVAKREGAVVVRHGLNRGQGAALGTGIRYALEWGADIIVTFDADGQHQAADVPRLVEPLLLGRCDVTLGSRFCRGAAVVGMPRARRLLVAIAARFDRLRTGLAITDTHNGLRAFTRQAAARLVIRHDGMAHASEILDEIARHGLRFTEVPVSVRYTPYAGGKGQRLGASWAIVRDLVLGRWA